MQNALKDFNTSLARVREIANDNDNNIQAIMSHPAVRDRYETIRCASTVILSGFLESFLKQLADRYINAICALNRPFSSLPDKIRYSHYEFGGVVLSQRAKDDRANRPSRVQATVDDIASRLDSVSGTPYDLVWEAFAETHANPNSETITIYLKRFGIEKPWEKIANEVGLGPWDCKANSIAFYSCDTNAPTPVQRVLSQPQVKFADSVTCLG